MIIHHYNTHLRGGAAIAARGLHETLKELGIRSRFHALPWKDQTFDDSYRTFGRPFFPNDYPTRIMDRLSGRRRKRMRISQDLDRYLADRPEHSDLFSVSELPHKTPPDLSRETPDVIHLHWIPELLDYPSFFGNIPKGIPVVWSLHDMNPFTGGCHYAWDCARYRDQCGECPQLNQNRAPEDLSHRNLRIKMDALRDVPVHVVANSRWLEQCARESALFSRAPTIRTIHWGIDTQIFRPVEKLECRRALSLDENAPVLSFGAERYSGRRKGIHVLIEALGLWKGPAPTVLIFGGGDVRAADFPSQFRVKILGSVDPPEKLVPIYSASDVFVFPSLHEAFGLTALEAMACGVPVVGFQTGGVSDIVHSGQTGFLVHVADAKALAEKISWLLEHQEERDRMSRNARAQAEANFSIQTQTAKYADLYKEITQDGPAKAYPMKS